MRVCITDNAFKHSTLARCETVSNECKDRSTGAAWQRFRPCVQLAQCFYCSADPALQCMHWLPTDCKGASCIARNNIPTCARNSLCSHHTYLRLQQSLQESHPPALATVSAPVTGWNLSFACHWARPEAAARRAASPCCMSRQE